MAFSAEMPTCKRKVLYVCEMLDVCVEIGNPNCFSQSGTASTLNTFLHYSFDLSLSMSSFNDNDGLAKQLYFSFLEILPAISPILPETWSSPDCIVSKLLCYNGMTSRIASCLLSWCQRAGQKEMMMNEVIVKKIMK